ncbi:MAG: aromatic acid exporter family protein [Vallitaleaceae bacterium]|jgi:uncharacterized membrane protein YgaE (UPF0421/DUF939 family)|nr:aromatic acid exporter family protein [Vallitaleaceae bacterium]
MRNLIYRAIKIAVAVVLAIFIAEILGLHYSITAGVLAMLSILDSRIQTYVVGIKRVGIALIGLILASILFYFGGFNLVILGGFILLFVPVVTIMKSSEALVASTVLVTHMYTLKLYGIPIILNEMALLLIGVMVAWGLNLHMPSIEKEIRGIQEDVEKHIKTILHKMTLQLINQCSIEEQENILASLDTLLIKGLEKAVQYNNNYVLKDNTYFIRYFQMRRQQYVVITHMEKHFHTMFITIDQALPLSDFTEKIAIQLNECNSGEMILKEAQELKKYYQKSALPATRIEFENRATLYQYLNDITYFIEIKVKFMAQYGDIIYCKASYLGSRD